jgi:hypothetical protein
MATQKRIRPKNDIRAAKFARETKPQIETAEPEAIEDFIRGNGPCRRIATVYLSRLWRSSAKDIVEDREFAVAMAATFLALEESRANYFTLAMLMESAYERLREALYKREDVEAILADAAKHEALH